MEASLRKAADVDAKAAATRLKYRLMPFSHGTRACPGYGFAMMQVSTATVTWQTHVVAQARTTQHINL